MNFSGLRTLVYDLLADEEGITWTEEELNRWLVEGELTIIQYRPDSSAVTEAIPLVAGVKQAIPSTAFRLLGIVRNESGRAIRLVDQEIKDELDPDWYSASSTDVVREYVFDERTPKEFCVSPPSLGGVNVIAKISKKLPDYDFGTDPDTTIDDIYQSQLVDYAAYRCLSQSDENTAEFAKARSFYASFANSLGIKTKSDAGASPKSRGQDKL